MSDESHRSKYVKNIDGLILYGLEIMITHSVMPQPQIDWVLPESRINFQACSLSRGVEKGDTLGYHVYDS